VRRQTVRYVAAALAATMALIYFLIGINVLTVVTPVDGDASMLIFGASAGAAFLLGALLLVAFDRRVLWILGAILQVLVVWGYFAVAPDRTPSFEAWGIALRVIQVPLFAALLYLAVRSAATSAATGKPLLKGIRRHENARDLRVTDRQHKGDS
jgi:hypothetical protein